MSPLKIGACLNARAVIDHRDWLFEADRDVELQDFWSPKALTSEFEDRIAAVLSVLDGHKGRRGIHGPYEGLDINNRDSELRPLIAARYIKAIEAADRIGARQMVIHSPYNVWYENNRLSEASYAAAELAQIHALLTPIVTAAQDKGVTLVVENIEDINPATRRVMIESFGSSAIALLIDTGHAHIARRTGGAPPVDFFVRDAGDQLQHVHLQDVDGHADRHWAPGDGEVEWNAVFAALGECTSVPHLVLELRDHSDVSRCFTHLKSLGLVE